jgi:catechol 2,3-dioxygenase-like lactoylglutathione lyase family enzyme
MDWTLEVVILPVSDMDRSIAFYRDQVGFQLDHHTTNEHMNVVQLTPPGSGCSIVFGDLPSQNEMAPGSMHGLQLVVSDADAARQELLDRGVEASEIVAMAAPCSVSPTRTATPGPCSRSRRAPRNR